MSDCSNSVTKYIIVEPSQQGGSFSGMTICGGGGLTVDFITGCTSDGVNVEGGIFNDGVLTIPTIISTTYSGGTFYGDGSNLTGISTIDSYMTGGTYSNGFITFSGSGVFSEVSIDVSALIDDTNYYVTGGTVSGTNLLLGRNGGLSDVVIDTSSYFSTDSFVTGSTLNGNTLELGRNNGLSTLTTDLSQFIDNTDNFVTGGTMVGTTLVLNRTNALSAVTVDMSQFIDDTNFYVTGQTLNGTILETSRNGGLNTLSTDLSSLQFTGNTSGSCISNLHISNLHGCSPITVQDNLELASGVTINSAVSTTELDMDFNGVNNIGLTSTLLDAYGTGNTVTQGLQILDYGIQYIEFGTDLHSQSTTSQGMFMFGPYAYWWSTDTTDPLNELQGGFNIYNNRLFDGVVTLGTRESFPSSASVNQAKIKAGVVNTFVSGGRKITAKTSNTSYTEKLGYNFNHGSFETIVSAATPTVDRLQIHQDKSGVIALTSDLTGFTSTDYYVTGATMNGNTLELGRNGLSDVTVDLSQFVDDTDTSVTGLTYNPTTFDLTLYQDNGKPSYTSNLSALASDIFVMSGDYDISTGIVTYTTNSGTTFEVSGFTSGMTDSYTSDAYLSGNEIRFDNNIQGTNLYNVDLTPLLSGKTDNNDFWSHTGDTNNPHQTSFSNLTSTGHTHTLSEITDFSSYSGSVQTQIDNKVDNSTFTSYTADTQNILNTKIDGGTNVGGGNEIFSGITGTDMNFRTLSGGSNTTISTIGDVVKIDVVVPADVNSFVTGSTMNGNILELGRNGGLSTLTTDLSQFIDNTDNFVTGGTMVGTTLVLNRTNALSAVTVDMSQFVNTDTNYFTTGGTYDTGNIFFSGNSLETSFVVDVSALIDDTNSFVTGGTVSGTDLVLGRNGGLPDVTIDTSAYFDNTDNFVTGGTMVGTTLVLNRTNALSAVTVDMSQFIDDTNFYVTGSTMNGNTLELSRNGGLPTLTTDLSQFIDTDNFVTGATYSNGTITLSRQNGTVDVDVPDAYVTGATLNGTDLELSRNEGLSTLSVDLSSLVDDTNFYVTGGTVSGTDLVLGRNGGLLDVTIDTSAYFDNTDRFVTGATMNSNTLELSRSGGLSDVTVDLSQFIDVNDGVVSGATMNGNTLELSRTEGLSDVTVDLSQFIDNTNYYVTGSTMNGNTLELSRNGGLTTLTTDLSQFIDTDNFVTGATYSNGTITLSRQNGEVTVDVPDAYITGATLNGTDLELSRNEGLSTLTADLSSLIDDTNYYVTGSTLNGNTLELGRNGGLSTLTTDLSGLNPDTTLDRKLFIPASMASNMGSSSLTYHGTTGVALLAFGGGNPENEMGSFPMVIPQDYVSGGTIELIYTTQTTVNDVVWSFAITNCSDGEDFATITESGAHLDLVSGGQTFLNRGTTSATTPTGTTFNVNDTVTVRVNRDASDSRDTANNITGYIYGLIFNYKANN
jgi:hypothetical protein